MINTVRGRLTLWYVSVLALVLAIFSVGVYTLLSRALYARVDDSLRSTIEISTRSLSNDIEEGQSKQSAARSTVAELFNPQQAIAVFDESGALLAENTLGEEFHARLPALGSIPEEEVYLYTVPEENDRDDYHRVAVRRVKISPSNIPYIILVNQPLGVVEDELDLLRKILYYGDEDLLRQMVLNLVDNAVKFTPPGGVVSLGLARRENEYLLSVTDTGPGLPAEARDHIFERFYRADKARSRAEDGSAGLGLAIARWLAQAHGGNLEIAASDQKGTTFVARLPVPARNLHP